MKDTNTNINININIKKWLLIVFIITIFGIVLFSFLSRAVYRSVIYSPKQFKLSTNITTLIMGASHTHRAFNCTVITNSFNFSMDAEDAFYRYHKLKYILKENSQIKRIILAYDYNSFSKNHENRFLGNTDSTSPFFKRYFMLLDSQSKSFIESSSKSYIFSLLKSDYGLPINYNDEFIILLKTTFGDVEHKDFPFYQQYYWTVESRINDKTLSNTMESHFYGSTNYLETSPIVKHYFIKSIELILNKNIELILIATPHHMDYHRSMPVEIKSHFYSYINEITNRYPSISFYDFTYMYFPDEQYFDFDHLNHKGSLEFSRRYNKYKSCLKKMSSSYKKIVFKQ